MFDPAQTVVNTILHEREGAVWAHRRISSQCGPYLGGPRRCTQ